MRSQGLDTKHGLRLELSAWPSGAQVLEALAAGQLDVSSSVGAVPVLNAAAKGIVPARVVVIAGNAVAGCPGFDSHVAKPVDPAKLAALIAEIAEPRLA